jgi:hypothetical protein
MTTRYTAHTTATRVAPYTFRFPHEGRTWQCTVLEAEHCPTLELTLTLPAPDGCSLPTIL